jgi:hypothetical protein
MTDDEFESLRAPIERMRTARRAYDEALAIREVARSRFAEAEQLFATVREAYVAAQDALGKALPL